MIYLNKFLTKIKEDPTILKSEKFISLFGLSATQIKDLKKFALENLLIQADKEGCFLTKKGEEYLFENPLESWSIKGFKDRPEVNVEYLKEEKIPAILTKAIRLLAKHLIEKEDLKENSLERALLEDIKISAKLFSQLEKDILNRKRICLANVFTKYAEKGITKSLTAILILKILTENIVKIAIYEKSQFQLKFDTLMFDRMMAVPQNFEIQKTEIEDKYILKDISKIILNKKSENILEITKGLYLIIKSLDKYTMNTENLTKKTLRLRSMILNAKDPISLFERDIPKVLANKRLDDCDREFLNDLKLSLNELKNCTKNLLVELQKFVLESFHSKTKEELAERFLAVKEFIGEKDLKILLNNVVEINVDDELWINRIATFINKFRVPKDWTDEDYASFKVKTRELALKFFVIESTIGTSEKSATKDSLKVLNEFLKLSKQDQMIFLRKAVC